MGTTTNEPATPEYHLTAEQVQFFDDFGYLVLRNRIPEPLLERLHLATDAMMAAGRAVGPDNPDYKFADRPTGRTMFRVDYLHGKGEPASLELLGSPAMLGVAESLAGPSFVPTYESLVFKDEGDGAAIEWHQDAVHPRTYRIFNVDVYLDPSRAGEGALRVVPGSQRNAVDICELRDRHGWEPPGVITVELEPGDILVHDVMIVHGSEAVTENRLRRTIYYEFRAAEQILAQGPWDRDWIDRRLRLVPLGLSEHRRRNPAAPQFGWNIDARLRPEPAGREADLRIVHTAHSPGTFCSAGDVPGDLPAHVPGAGVQA